MSWPPPLVYDVVIPIPNAGDPFAVAFVAASPERTIRYRPPVVRMEKWSAGDVRRIVGFQTADLPPRHALLIDDLITGADTKIEAIMVARKNGFSVNDCIVLIDRQQGGQALLADKRVQLHSVFTITDLLSLYLNRGRIDCLTVDRVMEYLAANQLA